MKKKEKKLLKPGQFFTPYTGFFAVFLYDNGTIDLARNNLEVRIVTESQSC